MTKAIMLFFGAHWKHGLAALAVAVLVTGVVLYLDARDARNHAAGIAAAELECAQAQKLARETRAGIEAGIRAEEAEKRKAIQAERDEARLAADIAEVKLIETERQAERIRRDAETRTRRALENAGLSQCRADDGVLVEYRDAMRGLGGASGEDGIR